VADAQATLTNQITMHTMDATGKAAHLPLPASVAAGVVGGAVPGSAGGAAGGAGGGFSVAAAPKPVDL
jgi:hypothetical protein